MASIGIGIFFLLVLYRPFEPRVTAPKNLVLEYDGPGSIKRQPDRQSSDDLGSPVENAIGPRDQVADESSGDADGGRQKE